MKAYPQLLACTLLLSSSTSFAYSRPVVEVRDYSPAPIVVARHSEVRSVARCPSTDFRRFLEAFTSDETIQRSFTKLPRALNAEPEFPLLQSALQPAELRQRMRYEVLNRYNARVTVENREDGEVTSYLFKKHGCWALVGAENLVS